ncbi:MAG TPA: tetratricopeptide repeat protein [bacterium]
MALALCAYVNSFPGAFIGDDLAIVRDSPLVWSADLPTIVAADYWGTGAGSGLHRPLTILSYALGARLFGPAPVFFHLVNVLLHAGVAVLTSVVLVAAGVPLALSWLAGALFAVHPVHTEVIDIVTGRAELLAALFVLLAARSALRRGRLHRVVAAAWYTLALLSKESAATFPALLLLLDVFGTRERRAVARERWPLYALLCVVTACWLAFRKWALLSGSLPRNLPDPVDNPLVLLDLPARVLTALKVQFLYAVRLAAPLRLDAAFVDTMIGPVSRAGSVQGLAVAAGAIAAVVAIVAGWRRRQAWALGAVLHCAAFATTANLLVVTPFLMAERFAYLPSVGFCLLLAAVLLAATRWLGRARALAATAAVVAAALVLLTARTAIRNRDFADGITLWTAETGREPGNVRSWLFLAGAYADAGERGRAERALRRALEVRPGFTDARLALGFLLLEAGRPVEGIRRFEEVMERIPGVSPLAMLGLARGYIDLGMLPEAARWLESVPEYFRHIDAYRDVAERLEAADGRARR